MLVTKRPKHRKRITRSYRLRPELVEKIEQIADELGETNTYVLESLLEYAIKVHETEKRKGSAKRKGGKQE